MTLPPVPLLMSAQQLRMSVSQGNLLMTSGLAQLVQSLLLASPPGRLRTPEPSHPAAAC